jgi:hypothetical protein
MARIRTLNFLPEIFQTPTNSEFLSATLDRLVNNPITTRVQGYVGSKFGAGVNALDRYVTEPTKTRSDYQLEPGVVFTKPNESVARDFITYPGMLDSLTQQGAVTNNNNRLFDSQIYSWDSFTDLDKLTNYHSYYWIPDGLPAVTVSNSVIFTNTDYTVTSFDNSYELSAFGSEISTGTNPTISLLRGGTYTFFVNQDSQFFIQTEPGVSGTLADQPFVTTREVFGVDNNGASDGAVTFRVPFKTAQDQFIFPGNNTVDVVSNLPFDQVNGRRLYTITDPSTGVTYPGLENIDGVAGLNGLRIMFYDNGIPNEVGFVSSYYDETFYDINDPFFTEPKTVTVDSTDSVTNRLTLAPGFSTDQLVLNQTITIVGTNIMGGLNEGQVYFVREIVNSTQFTISESIEGTVVSLFDQSGINMTVNINQGQYEQGFYTTVNENYYRIQLVGDINNPVIRLLPDGAIPNNENITPRFGVEYINRLFYRNTLGVISLVPTITAPLDTLYYQDGTNPNKVGVIKIIENNNTDFINIEAEILGKINYTSPNGVAFTNGLKVQFDGNVFPIQYKTGQYYVENVGTGIELINTDTLLVPEKFSQGDFIPWDTAGFDVGDYDISLFLPIEPDYITVARNSISRNAWSRSNRWFHIDVINATATYNNNPAIATEFATQENKAKRPIIEFYPNLQLFNSGSVGKTLVDFYDTRTTDALSLVSGLNNYYPDVETFTENTCVVASTPNIIENVSDFVQGKSYIIESLGDTAQSVWNNIAGTTGVIYVPGDRITSTLNGSSLLTPGTGTAKLLDNETTITIPTVDITGVFQIGMYVGDTLDIVPVNSQIINITTDSTNTVLTIAYPYPQDVVGGTTSIVGTDTTSNNYSVFPGSRIVFSNDADSETKHTVFVVDIVSTSPGMKPIIVLNKASDGNVEVDQQITITRGYNFQGNTFYYDGVEWNKAQQKVTVNQAPLFDVFDFNGISFGDSGIYNSTSFTGCTLFSYGISPLAIDDPILGFPVRYSDINNIGDISFDVTINTDSFDYVVGFESLNKKVNEGYVHNYVAPFEYNRELGWQTSVENSVQYQIFNFKYDIFNPTTQFVCDVAALPEVPFNGKGWPRVKVYNNNVYLDPSEYTVEVFDTATSITLLNAPVEETVIQVLLLSDQVSNNGYYEVPDNLTNNPFNDDLLSVDMGDIRNYYRDIFINAPNTTGQVFGVNNYRDCGNLVQYGTKIMQNSSSLAIPGALLRQNNYNLVDVLLFNSREYVKYKQLLVATVANSDFVQRFTPAEILDQAIEEISASKSEINSFFWSDMLPNKSPFRINTYSFNSNNDVTRYPLSRVYNFDTANYDGVLVYLNRTINGNVVQTQLLKNVDYTISNNSPTVTVTIALVPGDKVVVKEYNQTYGSYVPYTPTKLGLYPLSEPSVVLDSNFIVPTYFIKGHDGSFTKLYGEYIAETDTLIDFRDQALLEFEKRIYNNVKLDTEVPISLYEILPGFFRDSDYSYDEWLQMYSTNFLNWVGQNRIDYKTQFFNRNNEFTYNYTNSSNKLNNTPILQGYWRGVYQYLYDTTTPNTTPWEMLGFANKPTWWEDRYGPAPYTSDNLVLWGDIESGRVYSAAGTSVIVPELTRPGLSQIIPVDSNGNLLSPLRSIVGNYNPNTFQKDWKVGDDGPAEFSYRRSSSYPFDVIKLFALTKPAEFYNLAVDLDNYKFNSEFNQYLVNNRSHLVPSNIEIYGDGIAKTSYLNWIVDYEKQFGIDATNDIKSLLSNLDVRLIYRLAGYSDKTMLNFFVEKGSPNTDNASLLIPDESYQILLYDNQPFDKLVFSSVVIQKTTNGGYAVFGNSQTSAYFTTYAPINNGRTNTVTVLNQSVRLATEYSTVEQLIPYGTIFYSVQEVAQFIMNYNAYLQDKGMRFSEIQDGTEINWDLMINQFLYWTQLGWDVGSIVTLNPAAVDLVIDKEGNIVQPLTVQQQNFILNQDLYPIQINNICVNRDGTRFKVHTLNEGDSMSFAQFNISNFEHGIVFNNTTLFNDVIYNLVTGLRQNRITLRGTKTAEWNGTIDAWGFILNQDNIKEWSKDIKYPKGTIVLYKNKYYTALRLVEQSNTFTELDWKLIDYQDVQKGLLPNSATRSYESTLYYNCNNANLEQDADLLSYSLIGYRPRDYLALADLTDVTQINVYKNLIKNKGTKNAVSAFNNTTLPQGEIKYDVYENWAIKSSEYGGVLSQNFVEFNLDENKLTGNPSIVSLTNGIYTVGSQQEVPIYSLFNYGEPVTDPNILSVTTESYNGLYPSAGYANFNDVKMSSYFFAGLPNAVDQSGVVVPIQNFYVRDYLWLASFKEKWGIFSWSPIGEVVEVAANLNNTATVTFSKPHNLKNLDPVAIVNFSENVDGYYIVTQVVNLTQVIINLNITNIGSTSITGSGIGLLIYSQRVAQPGDINTLPLLESEFTQNTVWVDENTDGEWAVYRKNNNYVNQEVFTFNNSNMFGFSVAYNKNIGYLISDPALGNVYRYQYDINTETYKVTQTISNDVSFGNNIAHVGNTVVISQPTVSGKVCVYYWNNTITTDELFESQIIDAPAGVTDWGTELSISNDGNWLYISDLTNASVYAYRKDNTEYTAPYIQVGETYIINEVNDTDFTLIGATENSEGIVFVATSSGIGNGIVTRINYQRVNIIDGSLLGLTPSDGFGKAISTDQEGDCVFISAPNLDYDINITDWGKAYYYQRSRQTFESQYTTVSYQPHTFALGWTPDTISKNVLSTASTGNLITLVDTTDVAVDDAIVFVGVELIDTNIKEFATYYVSSINGNDITIKSSRSTDVEVDVATVSSMTTVTASVQKEPLYVAVNGTTVQDNNYAVVNSSLIYSGFLRAGDIVEVDGNEFYQIQEFNASSQGRPNIQFGYDLDVTNTSTELLVGSPLEIDDENREGLVYRYTNAGAKFGLIVGAAECNVTVTRNIFINGYLVTVPAGNASTTAEAINGYAITNIQASSTSDNRLIVQIVDINLAQVNKKLSVTAFDNVTLTELGFETYSLTQIINAPHTMGPTEFGKTIKFNEHDSVVIGAPVGTKVVSTTFDFTDDSNLDNDTVFDNNSTRFIEDYANFGAVYMFDLLYNSNGSLINPGKFVYAQPVHNNITTYALNPYYGNSLDFNDNVVIVGAPQEIVTPLTIGTASIFNNDAGTKNWVEYRQSSPIVDISKIQNAQIFSADTNNTLVNLDYIDPLQDKLLGVVRENIDFVSSTDPASYNSDLNIGTGQTWGTAQTGRIWFNTSNVRFVNYHQDDVVYNSEYWGTIFPGSDVAVFTWVSSSVPPTQYQGPGTPLDVSRFAVGSTLNASNVVTPMYYFWARNTGIITRKLDKTLSDNIIAQYIESPKNSGIAYFSPLLPNTFAIYNSDQYINDIDSVLHIGYAIGNGTDVYHNEFSLIRTDYADDFLPGLPAIANAPVTIPNRVLLPGPGESEEPTSLYARMLDSLSGCNIAGSVVPDPFLPKLVQSGILARPRQSFFYDRLGALQNYIIYANEVLALYPISEIRSNLSFLFETGPYYDTADYWNYVNWWLPGYNDASRASIQVPLYADLSGLNVQPDTLVRVEQNGQGLFEVYRYDNNGVWTRVGLENGTIQFKDSIWNYIESNIGYSVDFFDTTPFDTYPSEETRNIIRALNEQIYIGELLIHRNKSLTLLFNYIQSETLESQNYLPWLNKTSLADVFHTVRELKPFEVFKSDNVEFLSGYINEVKPYHVTIKEFLVKYDGIEEFTGDITDFDLPAAYNTTFQEFITPQLVYSTPDNRYQYDILSNVWNTPEYTQWYQNYGLSITGEPNYNITALKSYMDLGARTMVVDNASGFPVTGIIKIGQELISYSFVNRDLNLLGGLSRGFDDSPVTDHIPGEEIFIDLPSVVILNTGSGYTDVPKVTAVIDTSIYPAPRKEAELQAIMSGDRVTAVNVIDPGEGYAVLPEIVIEPAYTVLFSDADVNGSLHIISLFAPGLRTGDLVKFNSGTNGAKPAKLVDDQWYYVGILESSPSIIVALYNNFSDAIKDQNRIEIAPGLPSSDMKLSPGARASIITSSQPTRENNIKLRFDRTAYDSQVIDWEAGSFYGGFFAGEYYNSDKISSSAITLETTEPNINDILASAQGVALEIKNVTNDRVLTWSSFVRFVSRTVAATNSIELIPLDGNNLLSLEPNASGTTIGFYIGMPIKFAGSVAGNLIENQTYYVSEILDELRFSVSDSLGGLTIPLTDAIISAQGLECYTGQTLDTAILNVQYPGILVVSKTEAITNTLTVPMTPIGTGGTAGFYTNLPIFFIGDVIGGLVENIVYYITTVIDSQTFTISESRDPVTTTVTQTVTGSDIVIVNNTSGFTRNDPIIVTEITGTLSSNIVSGKTYYVSEVISSTEITISEFINGPILALSNSSGTGLMTNQKDTVILTSAEGSMTMNVSLPVSPGQVDGQLFSFYQTSGQFIDIQSENYSNLISRQIRSIIGTNFGNPINRLVISNIDGGTDNFYVNMPIRVDENVGGLVNTDPYYVIEYSGMPDPLDPEKLILPITVEVINTSSISNRLLCTYDLLRDLPGTASLYEGMPITFEGIGLGQLVIGQAYFVKDIISLTEFTVSEVQFGPVKTLTTANGIMVGTGDEFIVVSATKGGSAVTLTTTDTESNIVRLTQSVEDTAIFDVSYLVGGYAAIVSHPGEGYAVNNVITVSGTDLGGLTPTNDMILTVDSIDAHGGITSVIRAGTPAGTVEKYYLQVRSADTMAVYKNALLTIPVSGLDFAFDGYTLQTVVGVVSDILSVDTTGFEVNDGVVFTGNVPLAIQAGKTYYLFDTNATTTQITELPGDSATIVTGIVFTSEFTMAKVGSIALLPEPFYFNQSIVRFNNRVYVCAVSNNDSEFIIGKWELLDSGDRRLNAMDRVIGYYQPTVNMPGVDLAQLFEGVEYPNTVYKGNDFQPSDQFVVDTVLKTVPFYPSEADISGIIYDENRYLASTNLQGYSAVLFSQDSENWSIRKIANNDIGLSSISYAGGIYLMTSTNRNTPIFRSTDGLIWTTTGYYLPMETDIYPLALSVSPASLNAVGYCQNGQAWVAVGSSILRSTDAFLWNEILTFDPTLEYQINGISPISATNCQGLIAVGKGKEINTVTGIAELDNINLFFYSPDSLTWTLSSPITDKGFFAVASNGSTVIAVGENGVIYTTQNGIDWVGLNEVEVVFANSSTNILSVSNALGFVGGSNGTPVRFNKSFSDIVAGTTYFVKSVVSSTQVTLSNTLDGTEKTLTAGSIPAGTRMFVYEASDPIPATLRDILFANNVWIIVGDAGTLKTSVDGVTWTTLSGFTNDLTGITFNPTDSSFTVVGKNNTILTSFDNGITWEETSIFAPEDVVYDIEGDPFTFGYAPEELVAGTVADNLSLLVTTRPGTNWPTVEYGHSGFSVDSVELHPESGTQVVYSFANISYVPINISLQVIDGTTGLATTLASTEYSIDWVNKTVTLNSPLSFSPIADALLINVYEVGNGDQLVKASTDTLPIRTDGRSGFNEIYLDCNFNATVSEGGGIIRPGTDNISVRVFETDSVSDRIFCEQVNDFMLNSPISFQGVPFGNLQEQTVYYVKTISYASNSITISDSYNLVTGLAGPTLELTDATGEMFANIQNGVGAFWTDPIVKHNGEKLVFGGTGLVTRSNAATNSLVTSTTSGLIVGTPITFCQCNFGSLDPFRRYYIQNILNGIEFTISETQNGPILQLVDFVGATTFITNDYSVAARDNDKAKLVFATNQYDVRNDYIAFSLFGQTSPDQYGYSVPETQTYIGNGSSSLFTLNNFVGSSNPENAIVEIDGVRLTESQYTISPIFGTILFSTPPAAGTVVSVTTYNDTARQYLTSQFNITGDPGKSLVTLTVSDTTNSVGTFDQDDPTLQAYDQGPGDPISTTAAGNFNVGITYTIATTGTTDFTLIGAANNDPGTVFTATGVGTGTGTAFATDEVLYDEFLNFLTLGVGTTSQLNINDPLIFSAPTLGGIIAGQLYYVVQIINSTDFVISEEVGGTPFVVFTDSGNMPLLANGLTVAPIESLINTINPPLATTNATASTTGSPNEITVASTDGFVVDQPVQFFGNSFDANIVTDGTVYFVDSIDSLNNKFTIKDFLGTQIVTAGGTGNMLVEVGGNPTVRITTSIDHNLVENTLVRLDGLLGSVQLNNNLYYAKIITPRTFDIYNSPYDSSLTAVNDPVLTVSTYTGDGYAWRQGLFFLETTTATSTDILGRISVTSAADLVIGTPVYFSLPESTSGTVLLGGLIQGQVYYVNDIDINNNTFTVSITRYGETLPLLAETGSMSVVQWSQENVDRLYVTINGYRVPPSKLRVNPVNEVSILAEIIPGDQVIITSMIPTATPDQETYINTVSNDMTASVYRISPDVATWTTTPLYPLGDILYVNDVSSLVNIVEQENTVEATVNGFYNVGLLADKTIITTVTVVNKTTGNVIDPANYNVELISLTPTLKIVPGTYINVGDVLEITTVESSTLYINGEQVKFGEVDLENNTVSNLTRGINGTARQTIIDQYVPVFGLSPTNELNEIYYSTTWNSNIYNPVDGDPLQISTTLPARFLNGTDN